MIDIEAILDSAVVPHSMRDAVISLARLLCDVETKRVKSEIVTFIDAHPDVSPRDLSLAIARTLHSGAPPRFQHESTDRAVNSYLVNEAAS